MIRFLSTRSGLFRDSAPVLFDGGNDADVDYEDDEEQEAYIDTLFSDNEDEPETSEMLVEGRLITTTHRVELVYEEILSDGMGSTITKIGFDRSCPETVSMLRSGAINTALVFENKKRHLCIYNIPAAAGFEICISTVSVDNRLLSDGVLNLDYYMEVHGVQTDHCKIEITLQNCE